MIIRKFIKVKGIVQGVGFRPFVFNLALKNNLNGWVNNTSEGVLIDIEGEEVRVEDFLRELRNSPPPLAKIEAITVETRALENYTEFTIEKSQENGNGNTLISPDVAICKDCERELKDPNNRRYQYPFINCTNCGPRFSIIEKLPYDRPNTTMKDFKLCDSCQEEYQQPTDRRFHAQPNACSICGPKVWITDETGREINCQKPIKEAINKIKEGHVMAIKGLGGFHLVVDGRNEEALQLLRVRKKRPTKPLALMMRDLETVKKYCHVDPIEEKLLTGIQKPIVLLQKKSFNLPNNIAPNNNQLGVMLPYTPLHHLLFDEGLEVLVMTSANISGQPILYRNDEALAGLKGIVDYFLFHDRTIHLPVDDSITRVVMGREEVVRVARGYAPLCIPVEGDKPILACGPNQKSTFSISSGGKAFVSQHIGDLENLETLSTFKENLEHFKSIYQITPEVIVHDLHPQYLSTLYGKQQSGDIMGVQHHHAHIVSCMVDNKVDETVLGIAYDGTGYGEDGKIWGGEFLICKMDDYQRVGHLKYVKMPGGEGVIKEPWRMAVAYLHQYMEDEKCLQQQFQQKSIGVKRLLMGLENNINTLESSSMGRFFDGVAALLDLTHEVTFEGEAAIMLEAVADPTVTEIYPYSIEELGGKYIINPKITLQELMEDKKTGVDVATIAMKFHNTVVEFTIKMCLLIKEHYGIQSVALSGGVFQNEILQVAVVGGLVKEGFKVYTHKNIPCNDGGISIGQLAIANARLRRKY